MTFESMDKYKTIFLKIVLIAAFCAGPVAGAEIGFKLEKFQLSDLSGAAVSQKAYGGKIVVFVFWSFKCPVSLAYNDRVEQLQKSYAGKGVAVLGIASGANENAAEIRANIANLKIQFPVLLDSEGDLAEKLGATHAPEVFILDGNSVLSYRGALDNNKKPGESGRIAYANEAIDAILSGRPVPMAETRPFGCSIKRRMQ
jgi:thiol-disulfide isomerase/thioredoxin